MGLTEKQIERRVRRSYEWGLAWRALLGFAPVIVVVAIAAVLGGQPLLTIGFGVSLFLWGVPLLWRGREFKRSVLPGVAAGIVPLTFAICASHLHACIDGSCTMVCIPACTIGGLAAGLVAATGARGRRGIFGWLAMSATALLTGAMGCVCMGSAGLFGLMLGYLGGSLPVLVSAGRGLIGRKTG